MCLVYILSFRLERDFVATVTILDLVLGSWIVTEHTDATLLHAPINFITVSYYHLQEWLR